MCVRHGLGERRKRERERYWASRTSLLTFGLMSVAFSCPMERDRIATCNRSATAHRGDSPLEANAVMPTQVIGPESRSLPQQQPRGHRGDHRQCGDDQLARTYQMHERKMPISRRSQKSKSSRRRRIRAPLIDHCTEIAAVSGAVDVRYSVKYNINYVHFLPCL